MTENNSNILEFVEFVRRSRRMSENGLKIVKMSECTC